MSTYANETNKLQNEVFITLLKKYSEEGFICSEITGREAKVLERIQINALPENRRIFLCSKKESGFLSAIRKSIVLTVDSDNKIDQIGQFSDEIYL